MKQDHLKGKTLPIGGAIVLAIILAWCGIAVGRLLHAKSDFAKDRGSESEEFFASASLRGRHSLRPLLRNPFRRDIRLYFDHEPKINPGSEDAWASNETGQWVFKIHGQGTGTQVRADASQLKVGENPGARPDAGSEGQVSSENARPEQATPAALEAYLSQVEAMLQLSNAWTRVGTGRKFGRECIRYRHRSEPVTTWIDREHGVALWTESDRGLVCCVKSIMKRGDSRWFIRRIALRSSAREGDTRLEFEAERQPALALPWMLTN